MKTKIVSNIWQHRKAIAEIATTGFIIGKGIVDFARKDGIGKLFAIAELGLGIGAAAIHTGAADKIVATVAERSAINENPDPEEYDPYDEETYDPNINDDEEADEEEVPEYDSEDDAAYEDVDEDGFDPMEFDEFINSGEYPESEEDSLEADETNKDTDEEEE